MAQQKVSNIKEVNKKKQLEAALGQIERQFGWSKFAISSATSVPQMTSLGTLKLPLLSIVIRPFWGVQNPPGGSKSSCTARLSIVIRPFWGAQK